VRTLGLSVSSTEISVCSAKATRPGPSLIALAVLESVFLFSRFLLSDLHLPLAGEVRHILLVVWALTGWCHACFYNYSNNITGGMTTEFTEILGNQKETLMDKLGSNYWCDVRDFDLDDEIIYSSIQGFMR